MSGLLSNEINNTEKISVFVGECKRMGIAILPPDVNRSGLKFIPEMQEDPPRPINHDSKAAPRFNAIRYGLAAIKHVGTGAMEAAIREREQQGEFRSLEDFCSRLDSRIANRIMLESLIKGGAFDFLSRDRAELFARIDEALTASAVAQRDRVAGQVSLFDEATAPTTSRTRSITPWSEHEKLSYEKELLGFYVSGHPLDAYVDAFATKNYRTIVSLSDLDDRASFKIAGALVQIDTKFTKREGKPFAIVWVEDLSGTLEVVLWNEVYMKVADALAPGRVVEIRGTLDKRDDTVRATAENVTMPTPKKTNRVAANERSASRFQDPTVFLQFSSATTSNELREVREILASSPGCRPVQLLFDRTTGDCLRMNAGADFCVDLTRDLEERLSRWLVKPDLAQRNV